MHKGTLSPDMQQFGMWILLGSKYYYQKNYQFKIAITHKNTNIYVENSFSWKERTIRQTSNQFHYSQINYNISCVYLTVKEKYLFFFFTLTHTLFVSSQRR